MDIVRRILAEACAHLNEDGGLLCEVGRGRAVLERDYPEMDFLWLDSAQFREVFGAPGAASARRNREAANALPRGAPWEGDKSLAQTSLYRDLFVIFVICAAQLRRLPRSGYFVLSMILF